MIIVASTKLDYYYLLPDPTIKILSAFYGLNKNVFIVIIHCAVFKLYSILHLHDYFFLRFVCITSVGD